MLIYPGGWLGRDVAANDKPVRRIQPFGSFRSLQSIYSVLDVLLFSRHINAQYFNGTLARFYSGPFSGEAKEPSRLDDLPGRSRTQMLRRIRSSPTCINRAAGRSADRAERGQRLPRPTSCGRSRTPLGHACLPSPCCWLLRCFAAGPLRNLRPYGSGGRSWRLGLAAFAFLQVNVCPSFPYSYLKCKDHSIHDELNEQRNSLQIKYHCENKSPHIGTHNSIK